MPETTSDPRLLSVGRALPPHVAEQDELIRAFEAHWDRQHHNTARRLVPQRRGREAAR